VKKKLKILVPLVLVLAGGAYKFALAKPVPVKKKIDGTVYVLPKDFVINLQDGRFAKLDVALVLDEPPEASQAVKPPDGFGPLPQEAVVRDIVTDVLTDSSADDLVSRKGRREIKERILKTIRKTTDVKAGELLLTDVAVQ
jgi:flagellar FliL protein